MALMNFLKPKNKLEEGGRCSVPVMQDEGEPEQKCPNCHRVVEVDLSLRKGTVKYRLTRSNNRANN